MAEVAALAVTGWFVAPLISKLVLKGLSLLKDGMKGKLENLQNITVPQIKQVIEKAEMLGKEDEKKLMVWLREIQDAAYEADNVLDEYDYELLERQSAKGKFAEAVKSPLQPCLSDASFRCKLKKSLEKLDKIASRVHKFTSELGVSSNASSPDDKTMFVNAGYVPTEPSIFGRDAERDHILDLLIKGRKPQTEEGGKSSGQHEEEEAERRYSRQEKPKGKGTLKEDGGPENLVNDRPAATGITIREREDTLSDRHAKVPVPHTTGAPHLCRGSEIVPGKAGDDGTGHGAATGMEAIISAEQGALESSTAEEVHPSLPVTALEQESSCAEDGSHKSESNHHLQMEMDVPVLPIVGVGGVGKTTLAQYIYNNQKISEHFRTRMWIDMPQNFDEFEITSRMVEAVHQVACPTIRNFATLQQKLQEGLHEKRFLLVLDNVWYDEKQSEFVNRERWKKLLAPLRHRVQGSVVLITSRIDLVAMTFGNTMQPIRLEGLDEDACLSLFNRYAFEAAAAANFGLQRSHENIDQHHLMEIGIEIARKIVSKLGGLPLAAKVLGGVLRNNHDVEEWNKVLRLDIWDDVTRVLTLSYKRLPPLLQQCVAHHGLYPKGFLFKREYLVQTWIAEGFISAPPQDEQNSGKHMEDIGSECLNNLVFRSFLQQTQDGWFVPHDLMHGVIDFVSRHVCTRIQKGEKKKAIPPTTKHLSIHVEDLDEYKKNICRLKNLRTLFIINNPKSMFTLNHSVLHKILNKSERLRTLSLSACYIESLPDSIGGLKHLRLLDLYGSTILKTLPKSLFHRLFFIKKQKSFHRLYHLLYLDLFKCEFDSMPKGLSELVNLRHLKAEGTTLSMISNLGRLTALQELKEFHVKKEKGHEAGQLRNLANLRGTLHIVNLENISSTSEVNEAKLHDKTHLREVWLEWDKKNTTSNFDSVEKVLDGFQPPPHITFLGIKEYVGSGAPIWMQPNLQCGSSLHTLILDDCENLTSLPPLGQLFPHLRELRLKCCHQIRYLPYLPPNLITLELHHALSLALLTEEELKISTTDGPQLKQVLLEKKWEIFKRDSTVATDYLEQQNHNGIANVEEIMSWLESGNLDAYNPSETILCNIINRVYFLKFKCIQEKPINIMPPDGNVQQLPSSLQHLHLSGISVDGATLSECLSRLHSLATLKLTECMCIISLPSREVLRNLRRLREVSISCCWMLISLGGLAALPSLGKLTISECPNLLTVVPSSDDSHDQSSTGALLPESLTHLIIRDCGFLDIERCLMGLTRLSGLTLAKCRHMTSFPTKEELMQHLISLQRLWIEECEQLVSVGAHAHDLRSSLLSLTVLKCSGIFADVAALSTPHGFDSLSYLGTDNLSLLPVLLSSKGLGSLPKLCLFRSSQNTAFTREQEKWLQHLHSLDFLLVDECEELPSLPSNLTSLTRLKHLHLLNCPQVSSLPSLPVSLECLRIEKCHPEMEQRYLEGGPDWNLIKDIHHIDFI